jgi:hypothetical protein
LSNESSTLVTSPAPLQAFPARFTVSSDRATLHRAGVTISARTGLAPFPCTPRASPTSQPRRPNNSKTKIPPLLSPPISVVSKRTSQTDYPPTEWGRGGRQNIHVLLSKNLKPRVWCSVIAGSKWIGRNPIPTLFWMQEDHPHPEIKSALASRSAGIPCCRKTHPRQNEQCEGQCSFPNNINKSNVHVRVWSATQPSSKTFVGTISSQLERSTIPPSHQTLRRHTDT